MPMAELVNRVAQSGLMTIDLEDFYPGDPISVFDLKDYLHQGLVLREKDFRSALATHAWAQYQDQVLLIICSADAIVPAWAMMLVAARAEPYTLMVFYGDHDRYLEHVFHRTIDAIDLSSFTDSRVVVKGCSSRKVPPSAYVALVQKLRPVVRSLMFGEPCSTVPVYKKS